MNTTMQLSTAIEKYIKAKRAKGFSENTITSYMQTFSQFQKFLDDNPDICSIDADTIMDFLSSRYQVSRKTKLNHHIGLSSLWAYLYRIQIVPRNIMQDVERPNPERRQILPFTKNDVLAILAETENYRNTLRNKTIIMLLLDTGLRASELAAISIGHIEFKNRNINVLGKGDKERTVPFSPSTMEAIMLYLESRQLDILRNRRSHLFVTEDGKPLDRFVLFTLLDRLASRANVFPGNPHRYRHTFAIQFLRNKGNIFTLQKILGHSTLDMVKKYLAIAQSDMERDHEIASPVTKWGLG